MFNSLKTCLCFLGVLLGLVFLPVSPAFADLPDLSPVFSDLPDGTDGLMVSETDILTGQAVMIILHSSPGPVEIQIDPRLPLDDIKPLYGFSVNRCWDKELFFENTFNIVKDEPAYLYSIQGGVGKESEKKVILITPKKPGEYTISYKIREINKTGLITINVRAGKGSYILTDPNIRFSVGVVPTGQIKELSQKISPEILQNILQMKVYQEYPANNQPTTLLDFRPSVNIYSHVAAVPSSVETIDKIDSNQEGLYTISIPFEDVSSGQIKIQTFSNLKNEEWPWQYFGYIWKPDVTDTSILKNTVNTILPNPGVFSKIPTPLLGILLLGICLAVVILKRKKRN